MPLGSHAALIIPAVGALTGTIVSDAFTRADSTSTMGNADTGQSWANTGATYGISSNKGYLVSVPGTLTAAYVNSAVSDCTVSVSVAMGAGATSVALVFRGDGTNSNWWAFGANSGSACVLYNKVGGSFNTLATGTTVLALNTTYTLSVVLSGTSIVCKVGGSTEPNCSITNSTFQTNTRHGFAQSVVTTRFDDFLVTVP